MRSLCVSVCPSARLSVSVSDVCVSVCLSVGLSVCVCVLVAGSHSEVSDVRPPVPPSARLHACVSQAGSHCEVTLVVELNALSACVCVCVCVASR